MLIYERCQTGRGAHVPANEFDNSGGGRAGRKDLRHALAAQLAGVFAGDDAAENQQHIGEMPLPHEPQQTGHQGIMRATEDRESDAVHVFLQGGGDDHLGRLAQAGVDNFHARVAQGASHDASTAVVAVQAGFGHQNADAADSFHNAIMRQMISARWLHNATTSRQNLQSPGKFLEIIDPCAIA